MSDLDVAIAASKRFESALEQRFGATGKGLHEKATSVEHMLDTTGLKHLRAIASIRNRIVHEPGFDAIPDAGKFSEACQFLDTYLVSSSDAPTPPLGSCNLSRYVGYRGFEAGNVQWLNSRVCFHILTERWEEASELRFVDSADCYADQEYWVLFLVNQHVIRQFTKLVPDLVLATTVARPGFLFALHPHVTKASGPCNSLVRAGKEIGRKDPLVHRTVRAGIDSYHREAVWIEHAGIRIRKNFFGRRVVERVRDQTMVSLA